MNFEVFGVLRGLRSGREAAGERMMSVQQVSSTCDLVAPSSCQKSAQHNLYDSLSQDDKTLERNMRTDQWDDYTTPL